ncbi:hypothetical protein Btru_069002, partial [Bulinus truncatus]
MIFWLYYSVSGLIVVDTVSPLTRRSSSGVDISGQLLSSESIETERNSGNNLTTLNKEPRCTLGQLYVGQCTSVTWCPAGHMVLPGSMCSTCSTLLLDKMAPALPVCPCLLPETCTIGCVLDLLPAAKFGMVQPPYPGLVMYNDFAQPPPAHKGYSPVYTDPKTGLPRPPMYAAYPAPPGQFSHPLYSPEFTGASPWHRPGYPLTSGAFAGSFPPSLSSLSRYGPPGLLTHPGLGHPGIPHPASLGAGPKSELMSPQLLDSHSTGSRHAPDPPQKSKNPIKKPLNAFMLFMKEQRPKVIAECTLRESSAINQILGRRLNSSAHGDENIGCKSSHHGGGSSEETRKKPYVKKPLNAFMLFMKEMRPKVISECTLKESAAINQILGRR